MVELGYVGLALIAVGCLLVIVWLRAPKPAPAPLELVAPRQPVAPPEPNPELDAMIRELMAPVVAPLAPPPAAVPVDVFPVEQTPTSVLMPRIDAYIQDALAATGMGLEPLARRRAARGSQPVAIETLHVGQTVVLRSPAPRSRPHPRPRRRIG